MKSACAHIKPGMDRTKALDAMQKESWARVEAEMANGFYFYGNGSCEIKVNTSTNKVSESTFKEEEQIGAGK